MESPGPSKPVNLAQTSSRKRSPKKSPKKQNPSKPTQPYTLVDSPSKTVQRDDASNLSLNSKVQNIPVMLPSKTVKSNDHAAILPKLAPKDPVVSLQSMPAPPTTVAVMSPSKNVNLKDPAYFAPPKEPVVSLPAKTTPPNTPAVKSPFKTVKKIDSATILLSKLAPPKDPVVSLPSKTAPQNTSVRVVDNVSETIKKIDSAAILLSNLAPPKDPVESLPRPAPNSAPVKFNRDNPPVFPSSSQPSTSLNNSPRTPTPGVNPFIYQNQLQNGIPSNPNMPHLNGIPYFPRSTTALQEYLVKSLKIDQEASLSTPHVDSLRITVNNDHTRRTVQAQGIQNIVGTQIPYQFKFPASVPFQYDQRLPAYPVRPRPPLNAQAQGNNVNTNNLAASYLVNRKQNRQGRAYDDEDTFKKVLVMGEYSCKKEPNLRSFKITLKIYLYVYHRSWKIFACK